MTTKTKKGGVEIFIDIEKAMKDSDVNESDLNGEIIRNSGLLAYYGIKKAEADRQAARFKLALELKEAEVGARIRREAEDSGKKMTVDAIKEAVRNDSEVKAVEVARIEADEVASSITAIMFAIKAKNDNLTTLAHIRRDEMKAKITIYEDAAPQTNSSLEARTEAFKSRNGNTH